MSIRVLVLAAALSLGACASGGHAHDHGDHDHPHKSDKAKASAASRPASRPAPTSFATAPAVGTRATCPVSKEVFVVKADTEIAVHEGRHYAFCCAGCKDKFVASPDEFAAK